MLQSFYNHVATELILGYFKNNPIVKGNRYFMVVSDANLRDGLLLALEGSAQHITISGIYQGNNAAVVEDPYETIMLTPIEGGVNLIIGDDRTATEDYLTTIRNSVGIEGGKYENYGALFILSDNNSSVLSSIDTTFRDLQSIGGPLHYRYIIKEIHEEASSKITKDLELIYFTKYLELLSKTIEDGRSNLYDFMQPLAVLEEESLKGHYVELDFFNDARVYDPSFKPKDAEMEERVADNALYFRKISDIMEQDESVDKFLLLNKFLDEKLSKKIEKSDNWLTIDIQEVLDSVKNRSLELNFELLDITMPGEGLLSSMVCCQRGNTKKKSVNNIIVCDESNASALEVRAIFNKEFKMKASDDYSVSGKILKIFVKDQLIRQIVGKNENHHDFNILKLACRKSFFKDIKDNFSIDKKGNVVVVVPDVDLLTFGDGNNETAIPLDKTINWSEDIRLVVPIFGDEESDTIEFFVNFGTKKVKFILKINVAPPMTPAGPKDYPTGNIGTLGEPGVSTDSGETYRSICSWWRKYLNWEQMFVDKGCVYLEEQVDDISGISELKPQCLELPLQIKDAYEKIIEFYNANNTIPSLCPWSEDLKLLYSNLAREVETAISAIKNRTQTKEEYNLTRLGVVCADGKVYFSPFHPLNIAYALEYNQQFDTVEEATFAQKLLTPFYLLPYIFFGGEAKRPYTDKHLSEIQNWLCYECSNSRPQERANDITTKMVWTKMQSFIRHFNYLFPDKECPITISTIGIVDDTNVIKGIVEFIKREHEKGVQKIILHEYVDCLMDETFFEKLNRLDSVDAIARELESIGLKIDIAEDYSAQEIIHELFTRVDFYKHSLSECNEQVGYSHIAFYKMDTGSEYIRQVTRELRTELSFNGLISIPSTINKSDTYTIGYGTKDSDLSLGNLHPMVAALNVLYANEEHEGASVFSPDTCVAKRYKFTQSKLLKSIYQNSNWVTFLNPEVDINFFYKQPDLYVVHYTDQYTINAKYDSITVTEHVDQYDNMLRRSYDQYSLSGENFEFFNQTMMNYFNCLNGNWMLDIVNKTEWQIREKMSIVAACITMLRFMKRIKNVHWIPVSLEEILRVTGSIGLPQEYIFSKKSIGAKGAMSDDLLMIGLDTSDTSNLKLYLYPIEVKASKNSSMAEKGSKQVSQTYVQLKEHLLGEPNFTKNIFRTFFATQFLTNAEKLNANSLLSDEKYSEIEKYRFDLLNLRYSIEEQLPVEEIGKAAVASFFGTASHSITNSIVDSVPVCEIHFSEEECFRVVADPTSDIMDFLELEEISIVKSSSEEDESLEIAQPAATELVLDFSAEDDSKEPVGESAPIAPEPIATPQKPEPELFEKVESTGESRPIRIQIGNAVSNNRVIYWEPNNSKQVTCPNIGITGIMGTGKTQLVRSIIAQLSRESQFNVGGKGIGMLVFDYKKDYNDDDFVKLVHGTCDFYNLPFNPLKLFVTKRNIMQNLPAITAESVADTLCKSFGAGTVQRAKMKDVIIDTYNEFGITADFNTWSKVPPTLNDVIDRYLEKYDATDTIYSYFSSLNNYRIFSSDAASCVSIIEWLDRVRVIDLTEITSDDVRRVVVSLILDVFNKEMLLLGTSELSSKGFRQMRAMLVVDEAHQFLQKEYTAMEHILRQGRSFGVGMLLSTQNIADFRTKNNNYAGFMDAWVLHHQSSVSKQELASVFGVANQNIPNYTNYLNTAQQFQSIAKIGVDNTFAIKDYPYFKLIKDDSRFQQ